MIDDIAKLTGSQGTGSLNSDLLQKYLKEQDLQSQKPSQPSAQSELLGKIFADLGGVIQADQPAQPDQAAQADPNDPSAPLSGQPSDPEYLKLREQLADKARQAIRLAQALEASLDTDVVPDLSGIESIFSQFAKIFDELQQQMDALRKKEAASKDQDVYKLKPTALHDEAPSRPGGSDDPGFSKKITTDVR